MIYHLILKLRHKLYDSGRRQSFKASVPTICVGNVTVGGTGKTPHTEMILRYLSESNTFNQHIAVLSRGYKRESQGFQQVLESSTASFAGDEPLQIKKNFPNVTVAVDKDRVEGCNYLCHPDRIPVNQKKNECKDRTFTPADIIVLDDAFQYRKLQADLNIVLVDYNHPVFKDRLMPYGRLRDLPERIAAADVIIVTKCDRYLSDEEKSEWAEKLKITDYDPSTFKGFSKKGKEQTLLFTYIKYCKSRPLYEKTDPRYAYSKKAILFSGIAKDGPLISYLSENCKVVEHFKFSDHHKYTGTDFYKISRASKEHPTAAVITTEKDAQRVLDCWKVPNNIIERIQYVPIKAAFLFEEEELAFKAILKKTVEPSDSLF